MLQEPQYNPSQGPNFPSYNQNQRMQQPTFSDPNQSQSPHQLSSHQPQQSQYLLDPRQPTHPQFPQDSRQSQPPQSQSPYSQGPPHQQHLQQQQLPAETMNPEDLKTMGHNMLVQRNQMIRQSTTTGLKEIESLKQGIEAIIGQIQRTSQNGTNNLDEGTRMLLLSWKTELNKQNGYLSHNNQRQQQQQAGNSYYQPMSTYADPPSSFQESMNAQQQNRGMVEVLSPFMSGSGGKMLSQLLNNGRVASELNQLFGSGMSGGSGMLGSASSISDEAKWDARSIKPIFCEPLDKHEDFHSATKRTLVENIIYPP